MPEFGRQLTRRVKRGEITGDQAKQTARQRQTFKAAYGADWRTKVFGRGGAKGISGPFGRGDVAAKRAQALSTARTKLSKRGRIAPAKKARRAPNVPGAIKPIDMAPTSNEGRNYLALVGKEGAGLANRRRKRIGPEQQKAREAAERGALTGR